MTRYVSSGTNHQGLSLQGQDHVHCLMSTGGYRTIIVSTLLQMFVTF